MKIDVYADVVCPWCYVGEKRLEAALASRPDLAGEMEPRWRPFQLRPEMPEGGVPWKPFAHEKFGGEAGVRAAFGHVAAAGEGIVFDFDNIASAPNTVDAHRLILFARDRGSEWEAASALFAAYFEHGVDLNRHDQLATVAKNAGMDPDAVLEYLAGGGGVGEVWASQEEAAHIGISGVPFYVFDGRYAVAGAQPVGVFGRALDAAFARERG